MALEQAVWKSCGCPIHEGVQGQVGWSPRQSGLVGGNWPMAGCYK